MKVDIEKVRNWMRNQLQEDPFNFADSANVLQSTKLAEDAASHFDIYQGQQYNIPDWIFEIALEECEKELEHNHDLNQ